MHTLWWTQQSVALCSRLLLRPLPPPSWTYCFVALSKVISTPPCLFWLYFQCLGTSSYPACLTVVTVSLITLSRYPLLWKIFCNLSNSVSSSVGEQILMALRVKHLIRLVLCNRWQKESHGVYRPVHVGFRYSVLHSSSHIFLIPTSMNGSKLSFSLSIVNFRFGWSWFKISKIFNALALSSKIAKVLSNKSMIQQGKLTPWYLLFRITDKDIG